ncbi:hypothetical protein M5D96_009254 [Drosophila gunungcola]|uniref:Uncharacterized protein n=1 Tax=Drosophila gunungcola TaxID=103775 RepID=A0A9P9YJG4_9MUSC|nr:hypothetical protein M5D96_009254 [Drosophila gunungcola]
MTGCSTYWSRLICWRPSYTCTVSAGVNFDCLEFITAEEIKEAILPIGIRELFREKLFAW